MNTVKGEVRVTQINTVKGEIRVTQMNTVKGKVRVKQPDRNCLHSHKEQVV